MNKKNKNTNSGFTLIELIVVVAIIAVLAASIISFINPFEIQKNSRDSIRVSNLNSLAQALELYFAQNKSYPAGSSNKLVPDEITALKNFNSRFEVSDPSGCEVYYKKTTAGGYLAYLPLESANFTIPQGQSLLSIINKPSDYACGAVTFTKVIKLEIK